MDKAQKANKAEVMIGKEIVKSSFKQTGTSCEISFNNAALINTKKIMSIKIS